MLQLLAPGEAFFSPIPKIAVNPAGFLVILVGTPGTFYGPVLLAPGGSTFVIAPPTSIVGHRLLVQGIVPTSSASNGFFASTDGHELLIVP